MLGMKTYNKSYIDACCARVDAGLRVYLKQAGKAPSREFEQRFFNDQALLLDYMSCAGSRASKERMAIR